VRAFIDLLAAHFAEHRKWMNPADPCPLPYAGTRSVRCPDPDGPRSHSRETGEIAPLPATSFACDSAAL
jgi:hypothetical protein